MSGKSRWFGAALAASFICLSASQAVAGEAAPAYSSIEQWIKQEGRAFSVSDSRSVAALVDKVVASHPNDLELLGFGEALHGSEDILQLRNRIFQRLVEAHGYTAIAIETGFPDSRIVNDYVMGGGGSYEGLVSNGFGWGMGAYEANRELVEWMRKYNADPAHRTKLRFYGFDVSAFGAARIKGPDGVLHLALDYLAAIDKEGAQAHRTPIDALLGQLSGWENPDIWVGKVKGPGLTPAAASLRIAIEDLINELRTRRPELVAKSSEDEYLKALRYALIARETMNFHAALAVSGAEPRVGVRGIRDAWMADNLNFIAAHERGRGKAFVFAHNGHLQQGKSVWPCCGQKHNGTVYEWWPAGSQLNEMLGPRYAVIGTALGAGATNGIKPAEPGTLEGMLAANEGPAVLIPTHGGTGLPLAQVEALPLRSGSPENLSYTVLEPHSLSDFDWLAALDTTEAIRYIPQSKIDAAAPVPVAASRPSPSGSTGSGMNRSSSPVHATIDQWIRKDAISASVDSPAKLDAAVDQIVRSLGDSIELLGMGEGLHASEDILRLRNRLFQRLVAKHGYSAIAIETGFEEAAIVNEYVAGRGPATYEGLLDGGYGRAFGRLEANRDLVEWMRSYNADPNHKVKLSFYGFDISVGKARIADPGRVLNMAIDYLASVDSGAAAEHRQRINALMGQATGWAEAWTDKSKSPARKPVGEALRIATEDLITELRVRRPELVAKSDEERYRAGLQYALVGRQMLAFHAAVAITAGEPPHGTGLRGVRDALMADNLTYIVSREKPRGKVLAFAHNDHLKRGSSVWPCCGQKFNGTDVYEWWPAGSQLNQTFGSHYAVIGSGFGVSDEKNGIKPAEPGTIEARLSAVPGPLVFIPTYRGRAIPASQISAFPRRSGTEKNLSYTVLEPQSFTEFDWLAILDSTEYVRQLPGGTRY